MSAASRKKKLGRVSIFIDYGRLIHDAIRLFQPTALQRQGAVTAQAIKRRKMASSFHTGE